MTPFLTPLYCLAAFAVGFVAGTIIAFAYVGAKTIAPMAGIGDADRIAKCPGLKLWWENTTSIRSF